MKILTWNVQGAKKEHFLEEIRLIQKTHQPDLMFLLETMVSKANTKRLISRFGFQCYDYVNPINHSGGIWVLWNNTNIKANILLKEDRAIHMLVFEYFTQNFSILSGIYAPAQASAKEGFWTHLRHLNEVIDLPWCLIGDFNELEYPTDKKGGLPATTSRLVRLPTFLRDIHASSIPNNGCPFTWKKRVHGHLVYEKLDRALGRQDWCQLYPDSIVSGGPFTCSDHTYILLNTEQSHSFRKRPFFQYQPHWSVYEDVKHLVRKSWSSRHMGTPMFRITRKLHAIKRDLKEWSSQRFGNYKRQIEKNTDKLKDVESQLLENPNSPRLNHWHFRLLKQRENLLLFNKRFWGKFARQRWLVDGDRNSRYFHQSAKTRKQRSAILRIQDDAGVWLDQPPLIQSKFINDFSARLTSGRQTQAVNLSNLAQPGVTEQDNLELTSPVTENEIYKALFDMDPHKAPGPDGFGASFYQDHWLQVKDHLCFAIKDFFISGRLLTEINHTFIALVPKVDHPETTTHFRPISLCNTLYKIIAKVLVNRMRPILQRLIHPCQSAFVPNRAIHDNILVAHEIMNKFRHYKGKKGFVALKIDMEKAYDRIEWDFLLACLRQLGFNNTWVKWISECISTVSYSLIINGESCGFFKPSRGLRQGDPLSPYLFLICMDVLARRLYDLSLDSKSGIGIKIAPATERIPCLFFADDSLIFCKTSTESCQKLKNTLDLFCAQSGQLINFHKSSLIYSKRTRTIEKQTVAGIFNISNSAAIGKYLGCSIFMGRPQSDHFQPLITKALAKLDNWKAKCFSKAGRVVLIQSNLESLPSHTMQCFKLPSQISDKLDQINRDFFWKNASTSKGLPLIAWNKICRPKKLGGLGLRQTAAVNKAFLAKLAWKLLTQPDNFWVQLMSAKYSSPEGFFQCKIRPTDSWVWRSLLRIRPFLQQGLRWKLGNGKTIRFWTDVWCLDETLASKVGIDPSFLEAADQKVCEFITADKQWDTVKLAQVLPVEIVQAIHGIPIPSTEVPDSFCWGLTGNGEFSTKSATWKAHAHLSTRLPDWQYKWLWKLKIMPKIRLFLWQLCHNALPSRDTLLRRGIPLDPICPACLTDLEDTDHIFIHCPVAKHTWDLAIAHHWLPSYPFGPTQAATRDHIHRLASHNPSLLSRVALLLWSIWKTRNALIFRNEPPKPMGTLLRAKRSWAEWKLRTSGSPTTTLPHSSPINFHRSTYTQPIRWQSPAGGAVKLNCDGTKSSRGTAAGFVLRNWKGSFILAGTRYLDKAPILVAEVVAIRDGLKSALEAGFHHIEVEGDNQVVIHAIQGRTKAPWSIAPIIEDIRNLTTGSAHISFQHIYRESNRAADWMAKFGCTLQSVPLTIFSTCPSREFLFLLTDDNLGRSFVRGTV